MSYTFYTINTVVDIGDGNLGAIKDDGFTASMNLMRLTEAVMQHSYPMMVSINKNVVDLSNKVLSKYYNLPQSWGICTVSTFKFSLSTEVEIGIDNIPLVVPTFVNNKRISKFKTTSSNGIINTSISKTTFK